MSEVGRPTAYEQDVVVNGHVLGMTEGKEE